MPSPLPILPKRVWHPMEDGFRGPTSSLPTQSQVKTVTLTWMRSHLKSIQEAMGFYFYEIFLREERNPKSRLLSKIWKAKEKASHKKWLWKIQLNKKLQIIEFIVPQVTCPTLMGQGLCFLPRVAKSINLNCGIWQLEETPNNPWEGRIAAKH